MPFAVVFPSGDGKLSVIWFGELWESNEIIPTGSNYQQPQWTTNIYTSHIPPISTLSNLWNIVPILDFMGVYYWYQAELKKWGVAYTDLGKLVTLNHGNPPKNIKKQLQNDVFLQRKTRVFPPVFFCQPTLPPKVEVEAKEALNAMNTRKLTSNQYNPPVKPPCFHEIQT